MKRYGADTVGVMVPDQTAEKTPNGAVLQLPDNGEVLAVVAGVPAMTALSQVSSCTPADVAIAVRASERTPAIL